MKIMGTGSKLGRSKEDSSLSIDSRFGKEYSDQHPVKMLNSLPISSRKEHLRSESIPEESTPKQKFDFLKAREKEKYNPLKAYSQSRKKFVKPNFSHVKPKTNTFIESSEERTKKNDLE